MNKEPVVLSQFLGLNTVADPLIGTPSADGQVTWEWLGDATNVDISDAGRLARRDGYVPFVAGTNIEASFSTFDFQRMYVVDGGVLLNVQPDGSTVELADGLSGPYRWAEINDEVFLSCSAPLRIDRASNEASAWVVPVPVGGGLMESSGDLEPGIYQVCFTHIDEAGREGGASPSAPISVNSGAVQVTAPMVPDCYTAVYVCPPNSTVFRVVAVLTHASGGVYLISSLDQGSMGREISTQFLDSLPVGIGYITAWKGRIYAAQHMAPLDQTAVWFSQPLGYHLFDHNKDFIMVPGRVLQLAGAGDVLLIGTDQRVFLYDGEALAQVAEYGVVPGQHADQHTDGKTYFWSTRGLCRAAPFENITEARISVPPGTYAGGGVIYENGYVRYVATLHRGGAAFNTR